MNILFFLKPKSELAYIYDYHTLRQALEIMEYHKYSSVPILNRRGNTLARLQKATFCVIEETEYSEHKRCGGYQHYED